MTPEDPHEPMAIEQILRTLPEIERDIALWPKGVPYPTIWARAIQWVIREHKRLVEETKKN